MHTTAERPPTLANLRGLPPRLTADDLHRIATPDTLRDLARGQAFADCYGYTVETRNEVRLTVHPSAHATAYGYYEWAALLRVTINPGNAEEPRHLHGARFYVAVMQPDGGEELHAYSSPADARAHLRRLALMHAATVAIDYAAANADQRAQVLDEIASAREDGADEVALRRRLAYWTEERAALYRWQHDLAALAERIR